MSGEHVFRFTTAAAHTPSWPSSSTRFKRVLSVTTSVWSHWAHGRYAYTPFHFIISRISLFTRTQMARLSFTCAVLSRISALTKRCVAWAAPSVSTTAAWRCRRTNTVRPSRTSPIPQESVRGSHQLRQLFHLTEKQHHEDGAKRKRGPAKSVCPYNKALALQHMRDDILGAVQDIEQLLKLGQESRSCPYYSTRLAIPPAQVRTPSLAPLNYCAAQSSRDYMRFEIVIVHLNCTYRNCLFGVHSWWCCHIRCCFTMRPEEQQGCS